MENFYQLFGFIEIEKDATDKLTKERIAATKAALGRLEIEGLPAIFSKSNIYMGSTDCVVPDFGHNHACKCENPAAFGVMRFFCWEGYAISEAKVDNLAYFGTYEILPFARLIISGSGCNAPAAHTLKRLE